MKVLTLALLSKGQSASVPLRIREATGEPAWRVPGAETSLPQRWLMRLTLVAIIAVWTAVAVVGTLDVGLIAAFFSYAKQATDN